MRLYHLRFIEEDYNEVIALGEALQIIKVTPGEKPGHPKSIYVFDGGAWDEIGYLPNPDFPGEYKNRDGKPLIFVNLLTPVDLKQRAINMAVSNPEIITALSQISRFFIDDGNNNAVAPVTPYRLFF